MLNRCLIDMDGTDWLSKFSDAKERLAKWPFRKGERKGDGEGAEIQIKSELSQSDRFTVACTQH